MTTTSLTPSAARGLEATVVLLRETTGFMFVPLLVESERAAAAGLALIQAKLDAKLYDVAWPVDAQSPTENLRLALLRNLDDAIAKLPPNAVLVLDASSSVRHALALAVVAYINHRREPLRAAGLRLLLCWPVALKDELLSNAPDLWSVRAATPWLAEADLLLPTTSQADMAEATSTNKVSAQQSLPLASAQMLERWHTHRDLKAADLSPRDAMELAVEQYKKLHWADAAGLSEAVVLAMGNDVNISAGDKATKARALNVLGLARRQLGNTQGALDATRNAVGLMRQLVLENSTAFEPDLAMSLHNLANRLSETGDRVAALVVAREAVVIRRQLAEAQPEANEPSLALVLNTLATVLREVGDKNASLQAAREAMEIYRRLVKANPTKYEPGLAASLNNLANRMIEAGDRSGALAALSEAVDIYSRLAMSDPAAYEPDLAMSTSNLGNSLREVGDWGAALSAAHEAVNIRRSLANGNPAVYEPNLAGSLNNLSNRLSKTGDQVAALAAARESVDIYRRLARANPAAYEPKLAMSVNNLANRLSESGDRIAGIGLHEEALRLYEQANHQNPGLFDAEIEGVRVSLRQLRDEI